MGAQALSSRAIIGMYYERLAVQTGLPWVDAVSNFFTSDQESETYPWLDMAPVMREWIGGRQAQGLGTNEVTIFNKEYEATLEILLKDLRRDKTPQLRTRISELVGRSETHWASLLSALIISGEASLCYDGQFFFDTDHAEGDSGTQSNDIDTDISALPAQVHGTTTAPSPEEFQQAIQGSITQMQTLVDDKGEPLNEDANAFHVMVPNGLGVAARAALTTLRAAGPATVDMDGQLITLSVNPRLTTAGSWTDKFLTTRTDGDIKPFIRQSEVDVNMQMKDENSEFAMDNKAIQVGIEASRNVGFGRWQGAVLNTLT